MLVLVQEKDDMKISHGKNYVTKGGYVVSIVKDGYVFRAPIDMCPGFTPFGFNVKSMCGSQLGWKWEEDGTLYGLTEKWNEALQIVQELDIPIPKIPDGYKWKDGYIQFRIPIEGENYIASIGSLPEVVQTAIFPVSYSAFIIEPETSRDTRLYNDDIKKGDWVVCIDNSDLLPKHKQALSTKEPLKVETATTSSVSIVGLGNYGRLRFRKVYPIPFSGTGKYKLVNGQIVNLNEHGHCRITDNIAGSDGDVFSWKWNKDGTISSSYLPVGDLFLYEKLQAASNVIDTKPESKFSLPDVYSLESTQMKKETAMTVAKAVGSFGFRMANYWLFEPATDIARPIVKAFRYVVFLSTICGAAYGYYHPKETSSFLWSFVPTVTVEAPEILK